MHQVSAVQAAEGAEFNAPGPGDFEFPPLFGDGTFFTKPMLVIVLGTLVIGAFFYFASRRATLVPAKVQYMGEGVYGFVRNGIAKDIIGGKDFIKYVPLLFSLFFFILVNNIYGAIPFFQLPTFSHVGGAYVLAGIANSHRFRSYMEWARTEPGWVGEELPSLRPKHVLFFGESEIHYRLLGRPRTRSETMLRSTSDVPASIVLPRLRSCEYCQ